jgi:hypothetical protein
MSPLLFAFLPLALLLLTLYALTDIQTRSIAFLSTFLLHHSLFASRRNSYICQGCQLQLPNDCI